ncbi:hypothetical protein LIA77_08028 [Sarocladium implicatum]|nr:hypothetical protein LIA77_08028 [Sarocladium implicatum]
MAVCLTSSRVAILWTDVGEPDIGTHAHLGLAILGTDISTGCAGSRIRTSILEHREKLNKVDGRVGVSTFESAVVAMFPWDPDPEGG